MYITDNSRILSREELSTPEEITEEIPLSKDVSKLVFGARRNISKILHNLDDRLVVVVGPCSIHDPKSAIEYANLLKEFSPSVEEEILIVMRVYFEKPRTTIGWKGLINDPRLDNSFKINDGLRIARKLLLDISELGLPTGSEFLDLISPQYISDLVSWGAIGARTSESQVHRELTSGLSCPVGVKNSTFGEFKPAVDALKSAQYQHVFLGTTKQGKVAIFKTSGNDDTHIILRGGKTPNYDAQNVNNCIDELKKSDVCPCLVVDAISSMSRAEVLLAKIAPLFATRSSSENICFLRSIFSKTASMIKSQSLNALRDSSPVMRAIRNSTSSWLKRPRSALR